MGNGKWYAWELEMKLIEGLTWEEKPCYCLLHKQEPYDWKKVKYTWPVCAPQRGKLEQNQPYH